MRCNKDNDWSFPSPNRYKQSLCSCAYAEFSSIFSKSKSQKYPRLPGVTGSHLFATWVTWTHLGRFCHLWLTHISHLSWCPSSSSSSLCWRYGSTHVHHERRGIQVAEVRLQVGPRWAPGRPTRQSPMPTRAYPHPPTSPISPIVNPNMPRLSDSWVTCGWLVGHLRVRQG